MKEYILLLNKYSKGFRKIFFFAFILIFLVSFINMSHQYIFGILVDNVFYEKDIKLFYTVLFSYLVIFLVGQLIHLGINYLWAMLMTDFLVVIKKELLIAILYSKLSAINRYKSGDIFKRIEEDTSEFVTLVFHNIFYLIANTIKLILGISMIFIMNKTIGVVLLILIPIYSLINQRIINRIKLAQGKLIKSNSELSSFIVDLIHSFREIKILNGSKFLSEKLLHMNNEKNTNKNSLSKINFYKDCFGNIYILVSHISIYLLATIFIVNDNYTIGSYLSTIAYFKTCTSLFRGLYERKFEIKKNLVCIERIKEILNIPLESSIGRGISILDDINKIEFNNVNFSYDENEEVLKEINLSFKKSENTVVVGDSGIGKTTLMKLLLRLYNVDEGEITINNINIDDYNLYKLRENFGVVWQDNILFKDTLKNNLLFSKMDANDNELWSALKSAGLDKVVENLPNKLNTMIGVNGEGLSGGQIQRLMIARCFLRKPKVIVLDEASSALDTCNENVIHQFINKMKEDSIVIFISHRQSTVKNSDKVISIEKNNDIFVKTV